MEIFDRIAPDDFPSSKTLIELANNLEIFLNYVDSCNNHISFYETHYRQLLLLAPDKKPYQVLKSEDIVAPCLLANCPIAAKIIINVLGQ